MDLSSKQSDTVIRLFSSALRAAESEEELMATLRKLENDFGGSIPHWEELLRRQLRAERQMAEETVLEKYLEERDAPAVLPTASGKPRVERVYVGRDNRTDEQIAASHLEYCGRRLKYVLLMAFANILYQEKKLNLKGYRGLENALALFYGFGDSTVARRHSPPTDSVLVPLRRRSKPRRTYTQHSPEYWQNFTCPAKRKNEIGSTDSETGGEIRE